MASRQDKKHDFDDERTLERWRRTSQSMLLVFFHKKSRNVQFLKLENPGTIFITEWIHHMTTFHFLRATIFCFSAFHRALRRH